MVISWPKRIKPDKTPRPQFHHVNDVVPTIYEILGIKPPKVVDGHKQDPIDGVSFAYTFDSATAPEQKKIQYFDIMGSRGIYCQGWMASTFGPRTPWVAEVPDISNWDPMQDQWELFNTRRDFSLMHDLAAEEPETLDKLKALFMRAAEENKVLPIGGGLLGPLNPEEMKRSTNTEWTLFEGMTRIPESQAPNVRNGNVRAEIEAEVPENVNGVIFAMGGYAGGVSLYVLDGELYYEYSALLLKRDKIKVGKLPARRREDRDGNEERPWSGPPPPRSSSGSTARKRPPAPSSEPFPARSPHPRRLTWARTRVRRSRTTISRRLPSSSRAS